MIKIDLKGNVKEFEEGISIAEVAKSIGMGLYKAACAGKVDGEVKDLRTPLTKDCALEILTFDDPEGKHAYWHTSSHVMAQAIQHLRPGTKFAIGPAIENGFYYDMELDKPLSPDDFEAIEKEMKKIIKEDLPLERFELSPEDAKKEMAGQDYKLELIEEHSGKGEVISFYKQGDFEDLCAGPHLMSTGMLKAVKLTALTGAYWRGNAENQMLTRVYGISFPKQAQLDEYLQKLEEAKARDHRKIGREMGLFMSHNLVGKGLPMFLPKGYTVWQELENYIKNKERKLGYQHVMTPCVGTVDLYKTSGHWDHYKENMFPAMELEGEAYVLRPMNCPHHMMIYSNQPHSYKQLPIRIGEIAHDFRYEPSGNLKGIERGRHFCQNDAHLFVTPEQIEDEFKAVVDLIFETYKDFNITDYRCVLSLRDPADKKKYHQDDEMWNKAEDALRTVLNDLGIKYTEEIGEAAFYGPKLDVNVKPAVGVEYTLSTCQLDFCLPAKFNLTYIDSDGVEKTPVVLHRAILGSLDRFMAYLIEETMGKFPAWLSPVQVKVLPISEKFIEYGTKVYDALCAAGIRAEFDDRSEKIGYKIRQAQMEKVNYMLILGAMEESEGTVNVRRRDHEGSESQKLEDFIAALKDEIESKR